MDIAGGRGALQAALQSGGELRGRVLGSWAIVYVREPLAFTDPARSTRNRVSGIGRLDGDRFRGRFLTLSHLLVPIGVAIGVAYTALPLGSLGTGIVAAILLALFVAPDAASFRADCRRLRVRLAASLGSEC